MIFILNKQEKVINILKNDEGNNSNPFYDDLLTEDLTTGAETFTFSTIARGSLSKDLVIGNYIAFKKDGKYKLFQIVQVTSTHEEEMEITVYSECAGLSLTNNVYRSRKIPSATFRKFLESVVEGTEWNVGYIDVRLLANSVDLDLEDSTCYAILENNLSIFGAEIEFRVEINNGGISKKYIDAYVERGKRTGKIFSFGRDIEGITKTIDSTELCTALIGRGKDGLTFRDVTVSGIDKPLGQDFVADQTSYELYNRNGSHLTGIYEYDTESAEDLLRATYKKLQEMKEPKATYEIPVLLLGDLLDRDWEKVRIGDYIGISDNSFNPPLHLMARVSKLETSFTNPQDDKCTLSNFVEVSSNITNEMRKIASQLEGYVENKFPIGSGDIQNGAVNGDHMDKTYMSQVSADIVKASLVEANRIITDEIQAAEGRFDKVIADNVEAINGRFETVEADIVNAKEVIADRVEAVEGKFTEVNAELIKTNEIIADVGEFGQVTAGRVEAVEGDFDVLESKVGNINTLISGNISSENIQTGGITGDNLNMDTIFVEDANIINVNADKIITGTINTNNVNIQSENGGIIIADNTQQFKDKNNKVRVQIGQDATGEFSFGVFDETGTGVLIDANGVKEKALADGIIKDRMIGEGEIGGEKINISSLITEVNKDTNTQTIKGSKILLDTEGQKLDVAFNSLKSNVDSIQVGGRNLYSKSKTPVAILSSKGSCSKDVDGAENGFKLTSNGGVHFRVRCITQGIGNYTISFYIKSSTNSTIQIDLNDSGYKVINTATSYQKIVHTVNNIKEYSETYNFIDFESGATSGVEFYIKDFKVETGTKATDWTPALEDVDNKIESNTTSIKAIQGNIQTLIKDTTIEKGGQSLKLKDEYSKLEQTVSGINTTVASHTTSIGTIQGTANNALANANNALANANNANSKIDGLEIGGRNLANKTNKGTTGWGWSLQTGGKTAVEVVENGIRCCKLTRDSAQASGWSYICYDNIGRQSYLPNKQYTISFEVKASVVTAFWVALQNGDTSNNITVSSVKTQNTVANTWTKLSATITTVATLPTGTGQILYMSGMSSATGVSYIFRNLKIEEGTKASSWTPSPEDVDSSIDSLSGKVTTVENKQATLSQSLDGFKTTVANTYSTKTELSNLNGTVSSINSRVSTAESSITQLNNKIDLKVESTEVNSIVNNAVNNVQIGGRNLLRNSSLEGITFPYSSTEYNWRTATVNPSSTLLRTRELIKDCPAFPQGIYGIKFVNTSTTDAKLEIAQDGRVMEHNETYTLSAYFKLTKGTANYRIQYGTTPYYNKVIVGSSEWVKHSFTFTYDATQFSNATTTNIYFGIHGNSFEGYACGFRLEKGTKATDWTPAPEDVDNTIDTKKTEAINSANASTDTKLKSYSTTTQMNSAIQVAKDSITNTVSQTYLSKGDATNTYATKSSLTQTSNSITASFRSSGGSNVIRNSQFKNELTYWTNWGTCTRNIGNWNIHGAKCDTAIQMLVTGNNQGIQQSLENLAIGQPYTVRAMMYVGSGGQPCIMFYRNNTWWTWTWPTSNGTGKWHEIAFEYTPTTSTDTIYIGNSASGKAGTFYFTSISMTLGVMKDSATNNVIIPNWTPHPSEIYDGSTVIDASGVTVKNGALKVQNKSGQTVLSGDSNGNLNLKSIGTGLSTDITSGRLVLNNTSTGAHMDLQGTSIFLYDYSTIDERAEISKSTGALTISSWSQVAIPSINLNTDIVNVSNKLSVGGALISSSNGEFGGYVKCSRINVTGSATDLVNNSPWYGMGKADVNLGSDRTECIQVAGHFGLRLRSANSVFDLYYNNTIKSNSTIQAQNDSAIPGYEAYRGNGHSRLSQANTTGDLRLELFSSGSTISRQYLFASSTFYPTGSPTLGHSSYRWGQIYSTSGSISTSDSKVKENIKPVARAEARMLSFDDEGEAEATSYDFYNYVKNTSTYTFNYRREYNPDNQTWLGVLADEIPDNIFDRIGMMSKSEEDYQKELQEQEEAKTILEATPIPISEDKDELKDFGNRIVEGTSLTYRELEEKAKAQVEEPIRMINSSSQIAMLQEVLSIALNKIELLEQRNLELEKDLKEIKEYLDLI